MKQGWKLKKLGDIASVEYGFTAKAAPEGDYRYVRITDIGKDGELLKEGKLYINATNDTDRFILSENDLLMARTGATFGKVLLHQDIEPSVFASYLIKIKFSESIVNKLYWYFSKSEDYWEQANELSSGSAQPHFNGKAVKQVVFSYPSSVEEQKQIVAVLDKAFTAIDLAKANIEKNLQNAKELFQSKLNEIFTQKGEDWEEKTLKEIGETQTGSTPPTKDRDNYGNFIPFVKPAHFRDDGSIITGDSMLSEKGFKLARRFEKGSVLMVCIGATIGKTGYSSVEVTSNQQINALTPTEEYEPKFFYYALLTKVFYNKVIHASSQATLPIINKSKWESLSVPFPVDLEKQKTIVKQLEQLKEKTQELELQYVNKLESLAELKKITLQKAFVGEL